MAPVIEIENLSKRFHPGMGRRPVDAVTDLSMQVEEGEIFGFLGPNGAGKTTTLKMLTGMIRPTGGTSRVLGHPMGHPEAHRRMGFMPEAPYFYDYLTGAELLDFMGHLCDVPKAIRNRRSRELLELVDLSDAADLQLRRYSKGMLQRIGIAQALIHDPELVVLDEPMTGLDPIGRKHIRNLILELRSARKTVFFSTHILADVELVCDRVAILHRGRLAALGPLDDLMAASERTPEIAVRDVDEAHAQQIQALPEVSDPVTVGNRLVVHATPGATDAVIDLARAGGGRILSVSPVQRSLEDIFMDTIAAPGGQDAQAPQEGRLRRSAS